VTPTAGWDVVVVGGANTDYLVRGPRLPRAGETVVGDVFQPAPGGKGANQAVAAARLGARVAFVARLGLDDRGDEVLGRLAAEGVDARQVTRDADAPTGVALIMVGEGGEKQMLTAPGANRHLAVADLRAAERTIAAARVVLVQLEAPLDAVGAALRLGRDAGARVVLDPAPAPPTPLPDELLRLVDVIKPNAGEARALTGVSVGDRRSAREAAERLLERGVRAAAVQAGDEGNLLVSHDGEYWLPKIPVASVDATGAGDAFAAAIAVMLAEGRSLEEAGRFANAAALTTTALGAQAALPRRENVLALLARGAAGDRR
jgi:ribokinase